MTIASALTSLNQDIQNARTAITNKGGIVTTGGGSSQLATDIATIPSGSSGKYKLLDRIKDDSNNEIGTVSGFFTDSNNVEYAVVCLDAKYRLASGTWCSNTTNVVTNLPQYNLWNNCWGAVQETATQSTQLILDFCTANGYTSSACTHCRSKSFVIEGVTYYGQLPNMKELAELFMINQKLNNMDTTASSYSSTNFSTYRYVWSSTQYDKAYGWIVDYLGRILNDSKSVKRLICPVLEIPL